MKTSNTHQFNSNQHSKAKQRNSHQALNPCGFGEVGLEEVGVLTGLGLTGRQARVYLALLKTGGGKAKAIADLSLVNRQEIYRIIDSLQQAGLVQRNVTAPTTFTATPITEGVKLLLQQKTSELNVMGQQAKQLTKKLSQATCYPYPTPPATKPCLGTVFEGDRGKKYRCAIEHAQHTIEAVTNWKRFKQLTTLFETALQNKLQNGAAVHIITEKPPNQPLPKWINQTQNKKPNALQLKTSPNAPDAAITIFDYTQAAIAFNPNTHLTKGPDLWTSNPTLIALSRAYFDRAWTQTET
jgi:sugar-specific transcriptional regulator TrmB